MESGLEDRNNPRLINWESMKITCLNGVRPRRPEQWSCSASARSAAARLNGVRPRRPEQSEALVWGVLLGLMSQWSPA